MEGRHHRVHNPRLGTQPSTARLVEDGLLYVPRGSRRQAAQESELIRNAMSPSGTPAVLRAASVCAPSRGTSSRPPWSNTPRESSCGSAAASDGVRTVVKQQ